MHSLARIDRGEVAEPLRIVIVGGSVSLFVVPERRVRSDGTYGEVLQRSLAEDGIPVVVDHQGKWFDMIHELRRRYEFAVRNRFPDVLILNYGMGEAQPHTLPTWLVRHISAWDRSSHPIAMVWRDRLTPILWRRLRDYQRFSSKLVGTRTWRLSPKRFAIEMKTVIGMARKETGCLVLVLDADPPGGRFEHWLPGMQERWTIIQRTLTAIVDELADPQVRLIPNSKTLGSLEEDLPDAIHRTADAHRRTAELLHGEILGWLNGN